MKKYVVIVFLFLYNSSIHLKAQCPSFEISLESQAEVNDFVANYPNCTEIMGNFRIGVTPASSPSNITDISGLSFITKLNSNFNIFRNPNLTSLNGLQNITSIGATLNVLDNNGLTSLDSLAGVASIGSNLLIDNNYFLESLDGLQGITTLSGRIYLSNNIRLTDISAFGNLETVGGDLDIRINLDLENLNGLEQLTSVGGDFILMDNHALTDINSLEHTINLGGSLDIKNNGALSNCDVVAICEHISNNGITDISNNGNGCNSASEIQVACEFVSNKNLLESTLDVFPNPTTDWIYLKNQSEVEIKEFLVFDFLGKQKMDLKGNVNQIDMSDFEQGVYFVKVLLGKGEMVKKIIKE